MTAGAVDPGQVLDRVLLLNDLVSRDLAGFERRTGLTGPRIHLLWVLGLSGPSTHRALAEALGVTPRNVTGLVDGLVASGHLTREPHPTDRRASLVTLTAEAADLVAGMRADHARLAEQLFGPVPPSRLADFASVLDDTVARFAALMEEDD